MHFAEVGVKMKRKYIVLTLFVLFLLVVYSLLTPFSKDVVNMVIVIIGTVLILVTFCYVAIKKTTK